jgi:hypothetical protein
MSPSGRGRYGYQGRLEVFYKVRVKKVRCTFEGARPRRRLLLVDLHLLSAAMRRSDKGPDALRRREVSINERRIFFAHIPCEELRKELLPYRTSPGAKEDATRILIESINQPGIPCIFAHVFEVRRMGEKIIGEGSSPAFWKLNGVKAWSLIYRENVAIVVEKTEVAHSIRIPQSRLNKIDGATRPHGEQRFEIFTAPATIWAWKPQKPLLISSQR